jgi:hypothetical protein
LVNLFEYDESAGLGHTDEVLTLVEILAQELERQRELSARVLNYISGNYDVDQAAIGTFLVQELPKLEDYEIDLILSPVFTPKLADQAIFAEFLGGASIPQEQWPELIHQLTKRPTQAQLITIDGRSHLVPLREVTLERYVHRLRLEGTISNSLLDRIEHTEPSVDRPLLKAIARRAVWEGARRGEIFVRYMESAANRGLYSLSDATKLLDVVESHKPAGLDVLQDWLPARQEVLRGQINVGSSGKPFFISRIEEMHGGERDQRPRDDSGLSAKEADLAFLDRLQTVLRE